MKTLLRWLLAVCVMVPHFSDGAEEGVSAFEQRFPEKQINTESHLFVQFLGNTRKIPLSKAMPIVENVRTRKFTDMDWDPMFFDVYYSVDDYKSRFPGVDDIPKDWNEATDVMPAGTTITLKAVVFSAEANIAQLGAFRTDAVPPGSERPRGIPIIYHAMWDACHKREAAVAKKFLRDGVAQDDFGYAYIVVYRDKPIGDRYIRNMEGWIPLNQFLLERAKAIKRRAREQKKKKTTKKSSRR